MKSIVRTWTDAEDERLKEMAAKGVSVLRIAAANVSVRNQARKFGISLKTLRETRQNLAERSPNR